MQWLFFKNIVRNEFLASNYPEIKVLHINIVLEDQILDSDPLLIYIMCSFCSLKKLPKVAGAATKLNLLIYPPRI